MPPSRLIVTICKNRTQKMIMISETNRLFESSVHRKQLEIKWRTSVDSMGTQRDFPFSLLVALKRPKWGIKPCRGALTHPICNVVHFIIASRCNYTKLGPQRLRTRGRATPFCHLQRGGIIIFT